MEIDGFRLDGRDDTRVSTQTHAHAYIYIYIVIGVRRDDEMFGGEEFWRRARTIYWRTAQRYGL